MKFSIYKSGQGYWTRVLSAAWFGLIAGMTTVWLGEEISNNFDVKWTMYIKATVMLVGAVGFGLLLYWLIGAMPRSCEFLIATDSEMKRVNWPSRREVVGSTWVVICGVFMLVVLLLFADTIFSTLFSFLGVLKVELPLISYLTSLFDSAPAPPPAP